MIGAVEPNWTGAGWLHASPLFTFAGIAFVYTPMKLGLQVIYQPRFDADRWLDVVEERAPDGRLPRPDHGPSAHRPPPLRRGRPVRPSQMCSVGSAPLAPYVRRAAAGEDARRPGVEQLRHDRGRLRLLRHAQGRGGQAPRLGRPDRRRPRSCASSTTHGEPLPPDVVGEVRLQMPGRQREYFEDPEATAEMWRDGWLVTGDLGKLDADGYLYIVGRSKDVIIRGGNNIHATDVEHALVQHEAVKEVAVVGVPHPVLGEDVVAFVVLHPGAEADGEELRAFGLEHLADYKVPRQFVFVDELPRNPTGKVVKPELRARIAARLPDHAAETIGPSVARLAETAWPWRGRLEDM